MRTGNGINSGLGRIVNALFTLPSLMWSGRDNLVLASFFYLWEEWQLSELLAGPGLRLCIVCVPRPSAGEVWTLHLVIGSISGAPNGMWLRQVISSEIQLQKKKKCKTEDIGVKHKIQELFKSRNWEIWEKGHTFLSSFTNKSESSRTYRNNEQTWL